MILKRKSWNIYSVTGLVSTGMMILAMLVVAGLGEFSIQNPLYFATEIVDIISIVFLFLVMISIFRDEKTSPEIREESFYLLVISFFVGLGLFSDYLAWIVQGIPEYRTINYIVNFLFYIAGPSSIYLFWTYCFLLDNKKNNKALKIVSTIQTTVYVISMLLVFLNCFFGFYFTVAEDGVYRRTPGSFVVNALPNVIMMVITCVYLARSGLKKEEKMSLLIYGLAPVIASILQIFFFGLSVNFVICVFGLMLVYSNVQVRKNIDIAAQQAKLSQYQLQPHFLYNGMISIRTLIRKKPEDAVEAMDHFIGYLRGSVDIADMNSLILVSKELSFVGDYLEIEKVRFGEKIQYEIINEIDDDFMVPPISIQPIVENAIRHGIRQKPDGKGCVKIHLYEKDKFHVIEIEDDGVGFDPNSVNDDGRTHIGLSNTCWRIRTILHGDVEVKSVIGQGTTITIKIPE